MAKQRVTTVGLDRAAAEDANRLIAELRTIGTKTSRDELVRALVWGVSAPQAAGMITAYIKHAAQQEAASGGGS